MTEGSTRAIVAALLANLGIAVAKFAAWLATGAASMLAESVHSLADSANQALLLWGGRAARRPATAEHPFGYGRERYFWAFVVSVVLFLLGGVFAISQGIDKLSHPHELTSPGWAIGVLLMGIVLEGFSLRTAIVESNAVRGGASWSEFIRHSKNPELPVVLLEDTGAMIGLVLALASVCLAAFTGNPIWDALGSIAIGSLLCVIAVVLAVEMKSLLIGEAASQRDIALLRETLEGHAGVERLIHLRTVHLGPDQILVGAKLELLGELDFAGVVATLNAVEDEVRARVPSVAYIYVEPDLHHPGLS
ncbi:MAG: cation diffusion facilitator family transporter [Myxococcota bacterium]